MRLNIFIIIPLIVFVSGCQTTESYRAIEAPVVSSTQISYNGPKQLVSIGSFINSSTYMRGLFTDSNVDRLGSQSRTILEAHLNQSRHFRVFNRDNLESLKRETDYNGAVSAIKGAKYVITGSVSEFGRKYVGDVALWGIAGQGKTQIAYGKVILNVVDVTTSEVVYSSIGSGEYSLSSREALGTGSTMAYDPTLTGKVLDLAIRESVDGLALGLRNNEWGN